MQISNRAAFRFLAGFFLSSFLLGTAAADEGPEPAVSGPAMLRNDHLVYLPFFSTAMPDRARALAPQHWALEIGYMDSNTIVESHNVTETDRVIVDAEVQRAELNVKYGLSPQWEIGGTLPYLVIGGGYMDSFIQSFEDAFGFVTPGARESRGKNEFRYLFRVNSQNLIDVSDKVITGLGDVPVYLKYQFRNEPGGFLPRVAARGILKLPTATHFLLGNDRIDGGFGLLAEQPLPWRIFTFYNVDVTTVHLPRKLDTLDTDPVMVSGSLGFEHFLTNRLSWQMELTMATHPLPPFHPDMATLNRKPMGVALGGVYRFSKGTAVRVNAAENINSAWSDFAWSQIGRASCRERVCQYV